MSVIKVSLLPFASNTSGSDVFYLANNLSPRKLTIDRLLEFFNTTSGCINKVNSITTIDNTTTLSYIDMGLGNVTNIKPLTALNNLSGNVTIQGVENIIDVHSSNNIITLSISANNSLDFSKVSGDWASQSGLLGALSALGCKLTPIYLNYNNSLVLNESHISCLWIDADFVFNTQLSLPSFDAPIGSYIKVRQRGAGLVTIIQGDANTSITTPNGVWNTTDGPGTRIQLVSLGNNKWEFK